MMYYKHKLYNYIIYNYLIKNLLSDRQIEMAFILDIIKVLIENIQIKSKLAAW